MDRTSRLRSLISKDQLGIEIGPSYNPVCPKKGGWNVKTLDHADQETLQEKYKPLPVDETKIEAVDYIWQDGSLEQSVPADKHGSFDYVMASHVVEHQPDLISFLQSVQN